MSYKLTRGEYTPDGAGGLVISEYIDDVLQNAVLALTAERHRFYPDGEYGSRIHGIDKEPYEEYAVTYIRQALEDFDGVFVKRVTADGGNLTVTLLINNSEKEVILPIE